MQAGPRRNEGLLASRNKRPHRACPGGSRVLALLVDVPIRVNEQVVQRPVSTGGKLDGVRLFEVPIGLTCFKALTRRSLPNRLLHKATQSQAKLRTILNGFAESDRGTLFDLQFQRLVAVR